MKKTIFIAGRPLLTGLLFAAGMVATPALAQDQAGDRVNQLVIYGDDPCPESS